MPERCYVSQGIHIPGCIGCAVYGHRACTCPHRPRVVDEVWSAVPGLREAVRQMIREALAEPAATQPEEAHDA